MAVRRRRRVVLDSGIAVLLVLVVLVGPAAGGDNTRSVTETYTTNATGRLDCTTNEGGACFDLAGDEHFVRLRVTDADGWRDIPLRYEFRDSADATLASGERCGEGSTAVPPGADVLRVEVAMLTVDACSHPTFSRSGRIAATYRLKKGGKAPVDEERRCTGGLHEPISYALSPDDGRVIDVNALILLDGVSEEVGQQVMAGVVAGYADINLALRPAFQPVDLAVAAPTVNQLFAAVKEQVGGEVPDGFHLVHALTIQDIEGWGGYALCIGGVRSRDHAFSISEARNLTPNLIRDVPMPVWPWGDAYIAAHEIGHLFGGGHDFANCAEGVEFREDAPPAPCTLMHPNLDVSFKFSTVNRAIVRGHALDYVAP